MRWPVDEAYPAVGTIRVVLDNLNTHKFGSLYEAFEPSEARRIARRLEFHYTPKHGSWLNMAEIEFSVFSRQCLNRRIGDEETLKREVAALERERNEACATISGVLPHRTPVVNSNISTHHEYMDMVLGPSNINSSVDWDSSATFAGSLVG